MPLNEPLETFRLLLKEAKTKIDKPIEIVLIGGAAALLSDAVKRVTDDIDISKPVAGPIYRVKKTERNTKRIQNGRLGGRSRTLTCELLHVSKKRFLNTFCSE